ncbi:helix-turn-helix domain-containing protein [Streptomyces sp. H28]|uniref:helix-turn-helix domain-containing protein n=1 Tax=Streptomyces sp. H28 TaxID=2775865 RepID=UPI0017839828|nr:helix-turn-helix domain-containing protein [Streptomyces sp. H28]MBD9736314.1 helix-turn-helix domain-containing protein [Streptomyces sp. H28]
MDSEYAPPGHYTTRQVAQALRISPDGVRKLVQRGQLQRAGGTPRRPYFPATQVAALYNDRRARQSA